MAVKGKKIKLTGRMRSKLRIRKRVRGSVERPRLSVFRSSKHIYAQLISDETGATLVSASTLDADLKGEFGTTGEGSRSSKSIHAAQLVGKLIAKRCLQKQIKKVVFDRNGYVYHGRIRAVAEGAREGGLEF